MEYNNFIQSSFTAIKKSREGLSECPLLTKAAKIPKQPQNLYVQLLAQKGKQTLKIEQWNFKCLKTLVQSQYGSNEDSQLDSVELQKKSYLSILEQKLIKFNPKLLIKTLEPKRLILSLVLIQKQLTSFTEEDIYTINIDDYQASTFNCQVTLQTIHAQMNKKDRHLVLMSSQQQFEVLEDSTFQKEKKKNFQKQPQQERKLFSQLDIIKQTTVQKSIKKQQTKIQNTTSEAKVQSNKVIQNQAEYIYFSKYSTKQISVSELQRKMGLANQTVDLIQQMNLGGSTLRNFLKRLQ